MLAVMPTLPEHLGALRAPAPLDQHPAAVASKRITPRRGFDALVARIVADFVDSFDARREASRIAERSGQTLAQRLVQASEPHHSFGHDLVGEVWEKTL